jgi:DNA-binding transcriptional ArsR family regulator
MMEYNGRMPRAPTTLDPFNAVAEPKRRQVLDVLAKGERPVNDLVKSLGWPQPQVSKHLGVLKKVGLVSERRQGRQRVYSLNAQRLRPIHDWVKSYERFWKHQLERIKARAEQKVQEPKDSDRELSKDQERKP